MNKPKCVNDIPTTVGRRCADITGTNDCNNCILSVDHNEDTDDSIIVLWNKFWEINTNG